MCSGHTSAICCLRCGNRIDLPAQRVDPPVVVSTDGIEDQHIAHGSCAVGVDDHPFMTTDAHIQQCVAF